MEKAKAEKGVVFCSEPGRDLCVTYPPCLRCQGPRPKPEDKLAAELGPEAVSSLVLYLSVFLLIIMLLVARDRRTQFQWT